MAKRPKQTTSHDKRTGAHGIGQRDATEPDSFVIPAHPPARNRSLLAVSVVLFVLWLLFLVYNALLGPG